MHKPSIPELIRQAAVHALHAVETLLPEWLPEGTRQGREWVARNTTRGDRRAGSLAYHWTPVDGTTSPTIRRMVAT